MSFNWPDVPFSGTEVDAFVAEYKEVAQAIYDDYQNYNVNLNKVKLPFRRGEDVRIFLEYGLEYAAFIVKQRAGNSGPGGDFDLSGSPLPKNNLPPTSPDTGPSADPGAMEECFQNNKNGNTPPGEPNHDPDDSGKPNPNQPPPVEETGDDSQNNPPPGENPPPPCPPFIKDYQETADAQTGDCLAIVLAEFFSGFSSLWGGTRWTYLTALTYKLVYRYIRGVGGFYTLSTLHGEISPYAGDWMREDLMKVLNRQLPEIVQLSPTDKANYGMDPNGNAYILDGDKAPGFKNSLGDFTIITDGTESVTINGDLQFLNYDGITSIDQIKQVRDDYGFNDYGFTNTRSYENGDMPGDEIPLEQIESGTEFPNANTSPCEAASYTVQRGNSGDPKWNYFDPAAYIRYIIAANHGIGKVEPGLYVPAECRGRPFAIHFDWR